MDEDVLLCRWVDNHLVHVLSPNIYRNYKEALESFNYITTHGMIAMNYFTWLYHIVFFITFYYFFYSLFSDFIILSCHI